MSRKLRTETDCLNCGKEVSGRYCSHCGQENLVPRESFRHIMSHFITDYLHLDEKFFSSLKPLLFKPGFLTNAFNAGQRMRYVHPFRLYIFISIIYFLLAGIVNQKEINEERKNSLAKLDSMVTDKKSSALDTIKSSKAAVKSGTIKEESDNFEITFAEDGVRDTDTTVEAYRKRQASLADTLKDDWLTTFLNERNIRAKEKGYDITKKTNENFGKNIPKMIFMLLPVFAWLLYLLFRKQGLYYVEHFYHSVYIHSFLFLLLTIIMLIKWPLPAEIALYFNIVTLIALPLYLYRSCLVVYQETAAATIIKIVFAMMGYIFFLLLFTVINAAISFAMIG